MLTICARVKLSEADPRQIRCIFFEWIVESAR